MKYAGFFARFSASIIDTIMTLIICAFVSGIALLLRAGPDVFKDPEGLLYAIVFGIVGSLAGMGLFPAGPFEGPLSFLNLGVGWFYFSLMESSGWQATLGKKLCGIKVVDKNGVGIGFVRATGRYWGKLLSSLLFGLGFFMILFTEKRQGLHDIMAGCFVVDAKHLE